MKRRKKLSEQVEEKLAKEPEEKSQYDTERHPVPRFRVSLAY